MSDAPSKLQAKKTGRVANLTNAGKGRPKGVANKTTIALKDMILGALDKAGGIEYLTKQATENPGAFMSLIGRVLPTTLQGTGEGGAIAIDQITRRVVDPHG